MHWTTDLNIINESQAGFRSGYSAIDNIFCLQNIIKKYISKVGGRFYVLVVDFQKAFDTINHFKLFSTKSRQRLNGNLLMILVSMYSKLKARIKIDNYHVTEPFACNIGTVQSDSTSPLLINDLCPLLREHSGNGVFISNQIPEIYCLMLQATWLIVSKDNMADISKKPAYASPQTPLPTFPISATTLIIFLPIYKFILQKNFISPDERYKTPFHASNASKRLFQLFQFPQLP